MTPVPVGTASAVELLALVAVGKGAAVLEEVTVTVVAPVGRGLKVKEALVASEVLASLTVVPGRAGFWTGAVALG